LGEAGVFHRSKKSRRTSPKLLATHKCASVCHTIPGKDPTERLSSLLA